MIGVAEDTVTPMVDVSVETVTPMTGISLYDHSDPQ